MTALRALPSHYSMKGESFTHQNVGWRRIERRPLSSEGGPRCVATVFSFPAATAAGSIQTPLRRAPDGRPGKEGERDRGLALCPLPGSELRGLCLGRAPRPGAGRGPRRRCRAREARRGSSKRRGLSPRPAGAWGHCACGQAQGAGASPRYTHGRPHAVPSATAHASAQSQSTTENASGKSESCGPWKQNPVVSPEGTQ